MREYSYLSLQFIFQSSLYPLPSTRIFIFRSSLHIFSPFSLSSPLVAGRQNCHDVIKRLEYGSKTPWQSLSFSLYLASPLPILDSTSLPSSRQHPWIKHPTQLLSSVPKLAVVALTKSRNGQQQLQLASVSAATATPFPLLCSLYLLQILSKARPQTLLGPFLSLTTLLQLEAQQS